MYDWYVESNLDKCFGFEKFMNSTDYVILLMRAHLLAWVFCKYLVRYISWLHKGNFDRKWLVFLIFTDPCPNLVMLHAMLGSDKYQFLSHWFDPMKVRTHKFVSNNLSKWVTDAQLIQPCALLSYSAMHSAGLGLGYRLLYLVTKVRREADFQPYDVIGSASIKKQGTSIGPSQR